LVRRRREAGCCGRRCGWGCCPTTVHAPRTRARGGCCWCCGRGRRRVRAGRAGACALHHAALAACLPSRRLGCCCCCRLWLVWRDACGTDAVGSGVPARRGAGAAVACSVAVNRKQAVERGPGEKNNAGGTARTRTRTRTGRGEANRTLGACGMGGGGSEGREGRTKMGGAAKGAD
jgi:hypothetical protein